MRPIYLMTEDASGGAKATPVIPLDIYLTPFQVSIRTIVVGTVEYTVEYTESNIWAVGYDPDADTWTPMTDMTDAIANANTTLVSPVTAIRMRQTTGDGSVQLQVVQAGVFG